MLRAFCPIARFVFSFVVGMALSACHSGAYTTAPLAQRGVLDARVWNWEQPGTIELNGEWEFHWNQLLTSNFTGTTFIPLPSAWNGTVVNDQPVPRTGCATYRLRVLIDPTDKLLALRIGSVSSAASLYVNGSNVLQAGTVGCQPKATIPHYTNDYVTFRSQQDTLDIALQVANFHQRKGGPWTTITLGTEREIRQAWRNDIIADFFLMGSILIIAIYHTILFFFRKKDRSPLYFSLFCLAVTIHITCVDNYVINFFFTLPWGLIMRLEYLSFYLGAPAFVSFFYHLFPSVVPKWFVHSLWITALLFSFVVLLLPPLLFTYTTLPYQCIIAAVVLYICYLMIIANVRRLPGSRAFALGFVAIFLAFVHDVLASHEVLPPVFIFSVGLFIFIFFQTFLLSKRFSLAFNAVEEVNEMLSSKNEVINERNDELKQLNDELDVFVYRTSHDLRAPISSTLGLINVMRLEEDVQQFTTYLDLQEKSLLKLDNFIQDILNYSRNSRLEISPEPIDFQQMVEDVFALHHHMPNFVCIEKTVEIHQTTPFTTDGKRLTIVLNNLISNAIRYFDQQQDRSYIKVTVDANPSFAQITVADNGIGIAAEHLDNVFDMFYRATTVSKGSGLGLFITKEMMQKLKGTIQVRSKLKEGTVFVLTIPNLRSLADG